MVIPHTQSRRAQGFWVALVVLLNLGGGPMAWAHLAGSAVFHTVSTQNDAQGTEHCAQHSTKMPASPASDHHGGLPCCSSQASCHCSCPSLSLFATVLTPTELRFAGAEVVALVELLKPPAIPPQNLFRPPIV